MLILEHPSQIKELKLSHVFCALGVFDGVHIGHQKIISTIVQAARDKKGASVVITFDKHPYEILNPSIKIPILTLPEIKLIILENLGVDICVMMQFNKAIASIPAETWIKEILWKDMHIESIYLGENSFFGKDQKGDIQLLSDLGKQLGFKVEKLIMSRIDKEQVSSTSIRKFITTGDLASAEKSLARPYSVLGTHITGTGKGKEIGFPTINLDTKNQCLPPNGIYAVLVNPKPFTKTKQIHAIANLGVRPTFHPVPDKTLLEIHLLNENDIKDIGTNVFPIDLLEITFIKKLRDEIKFPNKEELIEQIRKDIAQVKNLFSSL